MYEFVRDCFQTCEIDLKNTESEEQTGDVFTTA